MIGAYLTDSVVWVKSGGLDQWNEPLEPTPVPIKARVRRGTRIVRNFGGEEVTSSAEVLMTEKPGHDDTLAFGDGARRVIAVHEVKRFGVVSHYRVFVA